MGVNSKPHQGHAIDYIVSLTEANLKYLIALALNIDGGMDLEWS